MFFHLVCLDSHTTLILLYIVVVKINYADEFFSSVLNAKAMPNAMNSINYSIPLIYICHSLYICQHQIKKKVITFAEELRIWDTQLLSNDVMTNLSEVSYFSQSYFIHISLIWILPKSALANGRYLWREWSLASDPKRVNEILLICIFRIRDIFSFSHWGRKQSRNTDP